MICPTQCFLLHFTYCKPCPVGKWYVLHQWFPPALHVLQRPLCKLMSCTVIPPALQVLQTLPVGKIYVLRSNFPCSSRTATSIGKILCPAQWFPLLLTYCKPCPLGKFYVLPQWFLLHYGAQTLPIGQIICPPWWFLLHFSYCKACPLGKFYVRSVILNTGKPAHWANSMSYPVIYPALYVPATLPVGQIPPRSESSGQGRWNTFPKCAEFPVLVLHSWAPPLPSPPLRLVSPSRRSERASERA